jgi:TRAP-type mannitol/chloroaromatic compound transport system permease small subunit
MRALLRVAHAIDRFTEALGTLSTFLVLVTIAVGFYNVVARYVGRYIGAQLSSNLFIELQLYLYSLVFFLGFAYVMKHNINVRVDFLYAQWSPRRRAWVDLLGTLFLAIPFCLLGIYVTIDPVLASWGLLPNGTWGNWELSPDPNGLPRAPLKSMIIVAFATLLLQSLAQCVKYLAIIRGHSEVVGELAAETEEAIG